MTEPLVSAIVLNYDGGERVEEAVLSLLEQDLPPLALELLVVDNGSRDGSDAVLERRFGPRIRVLRNGRNLGWGAGNNVGLRQSRGRFVLLLNDDAVAAPSLARELVAAAPHPRTGMVAAKVLDYGRRDVIDTVGHLMYPDGLNRGRGRLEKDRGQYDGCREALFPSGAAALYRRSLFDDVGLFDESLFLYGDDAELGLRARLAGWGCAFAPRAVAYHRYSSSAGAYSSLKAYHVERNRVLVLLKLFPASLVLLSPLFSLARLLVQAFGALSGRGAAGRLAAQRSPLHLAGVALRAYAGALLRLPATLAARRRLRPLRRLSTSQLLRLLDRHRLGLLEVALKD